MTAGRPTCARLSPKHAHVAMGRDCPMRGLDGIFFARCRARTSAPWARRSCVGPRAAYAARQRDARSHRELLFRALHLWFHCTVRACRLQGSRPESTVCRRPLGPLLGLHPFSLSLQSLQAPAGPRSPRLPRSLQSLQAPPAPRRSAPPRVYKVCKRPPPPAAPRPIVPQKSTKSASGRCPP